LKGIKSFFPAPGGARPRPRALIMPGKLLGDQRDDRAAMASPSSRTRRGSPPVAAMWARRFSRSADGVADDRAVAAKTRLGDHPALVEQGAVGNVVGIEVGHQGGGLRAVIVGDQQHAPVPLIGPGDHESRPLDFAGFELEARGAWGRLRGGRSRQAGQTDAKIRAVRTGRSRRKPGEESRIAALTLRRPGAAGR